MFTGSDFTRIWSCKYKKSDLVKMKTYPLKKWKSIAIDAGIFWNIGNFGTKSHWDKHPYLSNRALKIQY